VARLAALAIALLACNCAASPRSAADPHPPPPATAAPPASRAAAPDGPRPEVLDLARRAYRCARARAALDSPILTIIDYSLPSVERRLWVVNAESGEVLLRELVAHGRNSGENFAASFSNDPDSKKSSLGLFRTGEVYEGRHGVSLRLAGLEPGVNDRARERDIVVHGAAYVSDEFAGRWGRLGRSWGCPALDPTVARAVIDRIRDGTGMFAYYPDRDWLRTSTFLHCGTEPGPIVRGAGGD
jgi:hypothetical protein